MSTQLRTHKLQLESVTLNFRLWDGPPSIEVHAPPRYEDRPEYTNGRYFAKVEVHRSPLGVYIRALNEKTDRGIGIHRSLSPGELRLVLDDIDAAVARVLAAGLPDAYPNLERAHDDEDDEEEEESRL